MSGFDLVVIGDCNADLVVQGDEVVPQFGQAERLVDEMKLTIGGSGGICAAGAARLGLRVAMAGLLGDDMLGRFMRESLTARGVDVSGVRTDPHLPTGLSIHLVDGDDRAILTHAGTVSDLRPEMVDEAVLRSARHVHISSYFLQSGLWDGLPALLRQARAAGATVSLDPNWDPSGGWDAGLPGIYGLIDFLVPNGEEAAALARGRTIAASRAGDCEPGNGDRGASPANSAGNAPRSWNETAGGGADGADGDRAAPVAAARMLAAAGPVVVVKIGAEGALAAAPNGQLAQVPAVPGVHPVDSVGAGDSFDAGFLAATLWGWDTRAALALGAACGALSTRATGGTDAQPTRDQAIGVAQRLLENPRSVQR
jgi:sugar/nucleoside kinase (ribokinase family)